MGSIYWHCIAGQTVFPVQTAARLKIPLIIWGIHQGCDQVGMFSHADEVEMTRKYRKEHDLMGCEAEDLIDKDGLIEPELKHFIYPHDKEIESVGIRGIYLSNYIRWDSKAQHEKMIKLYGCETAQQRRTLDTYNDVDCFHYSDLHDWIKYLKYGYGKVTDHACREIRLKRLTRRQGIALVKKYQNIPPNPNRLRLFLDWLEISENEFFSFINHKRDARIWQKKNNTWKLLDSIINHANDSNISQVRLSPAPPQPCRFLIKPSKNPGENNDFYTLIGKGYPK